MNIEVRVPATSANLGPGFDALAVAVDVRLSVVLTERVDHRVSTQGEGAQELSTGDDNLIWRALVAWHERSGTGPPDASLLVRNAIPLERGLGSSAAAAVAGAALGRVLTGGGSDDDIIDVAADLEGHRDNAAAAVLGGLVVCYGAVARRLEPTPVLRPVLCVPEDRQATSDARRLLPEHIPLAEAAANGARLGAVLACLSGAAAWDPTAMQDVLHEPARFAAMPATGELVAALRAGGIGAALSGAGPAVLAVVPAAEPAAAERIRAIAGGSWAVTATGWDLAGASVWGPSGHTWVR